MRKQVSTVCVGGAWAPLTLALALALALAQARVGTQIAASVLSALGDTAPSDGVIASPP